MSLPADWSAVVLLGVPKVAGDADPGGVRVNSRTAQAFFALGRQLAECTEQLAYQKTLSDTAQTYRVATSAVLQVLAQSPIDERSALDAIVDLQAKGFSILAATSGDE